MTADGEASTPVLAVTVGLAATAAVAALVRWSIWWPHSDMRQLWAYGATGLATFVAVVTLGMGAVRLRPTARWRLAVLVIIAVLAGATLGFFILEAETTSACGPRC